MKSKLGYFCFLLLISVAANAATDDISIVNTVTEAMGAAASGKILPLAISWFGAFMGIQFIITNIGVLKSGGDIDTVWAKFLGSILWFSFCIYMLNNGPQFIDSVGTGILQKFAPNIPGPGSIITLTLSLCTSIVIGIAATGTSVVGIGNSSIAMVLVYVLFIVFFIGMYMAIKVFMLTLELGLIVLLAPLSFSFLGLNALKDQGIAPFKSLISLVYRIILLGIVFTAFNEVVGVAGNKFNDIDWGLLADWGKSLNIFFSTLSAFPVLAYLVYKSDSIAASLAGGSSNMGTGDVASAAAMGAAAGAAVASGGAAAVGAATKPAQSMANFMSQMRGGGSVSNASTTGAGGASSSLPLSPPPVSSMGSGGGGGSGVEAPSSAQASPPDLASSNMSPQRAAALDAEKVAKAAGASPKEISAASNAAYMAGSGASGAGINGPDTGNQASGGKQKTFLDHLGNFGQHIEKEKAHTSVSINTHHSD